MPTSAIRRNTIAIQQSNGNSTFSEDVALFIDWENFKISLAVRGRTPNVSALKEEVANHGRVVVSKAYADWVSRSPELRGASQFILDPPSLYAAGIEPVYVPTRLPPGGSFQPGRTMRIKNSVDVKMTADCIDTAHNFPNINTFVLVSGDSDFIHVINSLRAVGKRVLVVGVSWATSRRMADHVDGLIFYDSDVDPINVPEPAFRGRIAPPAPLANPGRHQLPEVISGHRGRHPFRTRSRPHAASHIPETAPRATHRRIRRAQARFLRIQKADAPCRRRRQHQNSQR